MLLLCDKWVSPSLRTGWDGLSFRESTLQIETGTELLHRWHLKHMQLVYHKTREWTTGIHREWVTSDSRVLVFKLHIPYTAPGHRALGWYVHVPCISQPNMNPLHLCGILLDLLDHFKPGILFLRPVLVSRKTMNTKVLCFFLGLELRHMGPSFGGKKQLAETAYFTRQVIYHDHGLESPLVWQTPFRPWYVWGGCVKTIS